MQIVFHNGCIDMVSPKCVFSGVLSYSYFDKKKIIMALIVQFLIIVYSLVFPQTLFLNKTIIKRATFLWFISSVYSHVIYKIIFSFFVTIAAMIWSISSVFSLVSYQTSILDIIFVTRAVVIFFSISIVHLLF